MRTADAATIATLNGTGVILRADLYTITPVTGAVLRFTDADIPLTIGGHLFLNSMAITRTMTKQSVGVSVDQVKVTFNDAGQTTINSVPIIWLFRLGYFKRAHVKIQKMFLDSWTDLSRAPVDWFEGRMSDIGVKKMTAVANVKSLLDLLSQQMPPFVYQPPCVHTLYDTGCGVNPATYTFAYTVAGGSTQSVFNLTGTVKADGYYALGKMYFTSGPNAGLPARTIKSYVGGVATVFNPWPFAAGIGDACDLVAGCDKTQSTCDTKFSNAGRFRGYRFIPVPETALFGGASVGGGVSSPGATGGVPVGSSGSANTGGRTYVQ